MAQKKESLITELETTTKQKSNNESIKERLFLYRFRVFYLIIINLKKLGNAQIIFGIMRKLETREMISSLLVR